MTVDRDLIGKTADDLVAAFLAHDPAIAVSPLDETSFHLNPMTLNPGEELIVRAACVQLLGG